MHNIGFTVKVSHGEVEVLDKGGGKTWVGANASSTVPTARRVSCSKNGTRYILFFADQQLVSVSGDSNKSPSVKLAGRPHRNFVFHATLTKRGKTLDLKAVRLPSPPGTSMAGARIRIA